MRPIVHYPKFGNKPSGKITTGEKSKSCRGCKNFRCQETGKNCPICGEPANSGNGIDCKKCGEPIISPIAN